MLVYTHDRDTDESRDQMKKHAGILLGSIGASFLPPRKAILIHFKSAVFGFATRGAGKFSNFRGNQSAVIANYTFCG